MKDELVAGLPNDPLDDVLDLPSDGDPVQAFQDMAVLRAPAPKTHTPVTFFDDDDYEMSFGDFSVYPNEPLLHTPKPFTPGESLSVELYDTQSPAPEMEFFDPPSAVLFGGIGMIPPLGLGPGVFAVVYALRFLLDRKSRPEGRPMTSLILQAIGGLILGVLGFCFSVLVLVLYFRWTLS